MKSDDQKKLDELLKVDGGLNDWEVEFLESLDKQRLRTLSEKQLIKLDQIYCRVILEIPEDEDE